MKSVLSNRTTWTLVCSLLLGITSFAAAQWQPAVNLSGDVNHYECDPFVAVDSTGTIHMVYQYFLDYDGRVYYTYNNGSGWSSRELIATTSGKGSRPCIVVDPNDTLHVFYGKNVLYWEYKPASGGSWSSPVQINSTSGGFINDVAVDDSGGIYFMWGHLFENSNPVRNGIYGRYKPLGGNWGGLEVIAGNSDDGNWPKGDDVFANGNEIWASMSWDGYVWFKKRGAGGSWGGGYGTQLHHGGGLRFAKNPTSNEIAAGYGEDIGGGSSGPWWEAFVMYSYDNGATWTTPINLSNMTGLDRVSQLTYDGSGNLHYGWEGAGCDGCHLKIRIRSRIDGTWQAMETLSPGGTGNSGLDSPGAMASYGNNVYVVFGVDTQTDSWWDVYFAAKQELNATLDYIAMSYPLLLANNTTQYIVTMQASDGNGPSDILDLRWLINYQGDNSDKPRGYIAWGQTPEDIGYYDDPANWDIQAVSTGTGYVGIHLPSQWGSDDYLTLDYAVESTSGNSRTVSFVFRVKPQYYTDGPLSENDISSFLRHTAGIVNWQNNDFNFRVADQNYTPVLDDLYLSDNALVADNTTVYTLTETGSDGNGWEDVRIMRWLINYQGDNAGDHRGYVSWGLTPYDIGTWGGTENWDIQPVSSGEGYIGLRMNGWGKDDYITPVATRESHSGNNRTVEFDFTVKPLFFEDGPLTDNDISGVVHDYYVDTGWLNNDLNFNVFSEKMPDYDHDGDIDQSDFAVLQCCITGSGITPPPTGCDSCDMDDDEDIDIYDVAKFDLCATAPGIPADASCLNLPVENMLPDWAYNPYPADGATNTAASLTLSWSAGTGATSHDVYFGTSNPPTFQVNQTGTTFDPGSLNLGETYYWRIDEVNSLGVTTGLVWSFTTAPAPVTNLNRYVLTNFNTGDEYYLDRTYTMTAMPSSLEGELGIKTNNDDRLIQEAEWLTFDLNVPADVYVAYDHRGAPAYGGQLPQWLSDDFSDSGMTVSVTDGDASPFILYVRSYDVGQVVLGSNFMPPAEGSFSNYFVFIKPTGQ